MISQTPEYPGQWDISPEEEGRQLHCLEKAQAFAHGLVIGDATGHDRFHLERVRRMARRLALEEKAEVFLVEMAALLHDAADSKLNADEVWALAKLKDFLVTLPLHAGEREEIAAICQGLSFSATLSPKPKDPGPNKPTSKPVSLAFQVVQDADRLDALGAVGIARCFAYGGSKGQPIHDPDLGPREGLSLPEYRRGRQSSLNHFHEKLLRLKDMFNTPSARLIAEKRHEYMLDFIAQFHGEWEGSR